MLIFIQIFRWTSNILKIGFLSHFLSSVHECIHPASIYPSTYLPIHPTTHPSSIHLFIHLYPASIYPSTHLSIHPPIHHPPVYPFLYIYIHSVIYMWINLHERVFSKFSISARNKEFMLCAQSLVSWWWNLTAANNQRPLDCSPLLFCLPSVVNLPFLGSLSWTTWREFGECGFQTSSPYTAGWTLRGQGGAECHCCQKAQTTSLPPLHP